MIKEIVEDFCESLRTTTAEQCHYRLRERDTDCGRKSLSALGVLCELLTEDYRVGRWAKANSGWVWMYRQKPQLDRKPRPEHSPCEPESRLLVPPYQDEGERMYIVSPPRNQGQWGLTLEQLWILSDWNDHHGYSFPKIATKIEDYYKSGEWEYY